MEASVSRLDQLKPRTKPILMDLVADAGLDVSDWHAIKRGAPSANPKYCYEWAFEQSGKVVLNLWHSDLEDIDGKISHHINFRERSTRQEKHLWRARDGRMDKAIQAAIAQNQPIRVIIVDGIRRRTSDPDLTSSKVQARLLDPANWQVERYDESTGECILTRDNAVFPAPIDETATLNMTYALVANTQELLESGLSFLELAKGSVEEQAFFKDRIRFADRLVVLDDKNPIFLPGAYIAYKHSKTIDEWKALGQKVYRGQGRKHLDKVLAHSMIEKDHARYNSLALAFLSFCRNYDISISSEERLHFWYVSPGIEFLTPRTRQDETEYWSDEEFDAAVATYGQLLAAEKKGEAFDRNAIVKKLHKESLSKRSLSSVFYRMRNISSVLDSLQLPFFAAYSPANNVGPRGIGKIKQSFVKYGIWIDPEILKPTSDANELNRKASQLPKSNLSNPPEGCANPERVESKAGGYKRLATVVRYVLDAAGGYCELCDMEAPFYSEKGEPFLEVHHIKTLAELGSDTITNAVGLCPNCHRRLHHSPERANLKNTLYGKIPRLLRE